MAMHVGIARVALHLAGNGSLKGKRMVVKSVAQRVRNRFNVAVAEIDTQDAWQVATLGIVCLSDDPRHSNEVLSKVIDFIESERLDADVGEVDLELIVV
ncbi:MAG TPA: DUF503 domain-containing protein [Chloroflexota bacterium]|nr:DUF503 domain-containing protein [Chloroflexota bacterium]